MATQPRDRLNRERNKVRERQDPPNEDPDDDIDGRPMDDETAEALLEYSRALDPKESPEKYRLEGEDKTYAPRTIENYLRSLRICHDEGLDLLGIEDATEFNDFIDHLHASTERRKTTLDGYQAAAIHFYRYHDHLGINPDDIHQYGKKSGQRHDERDMFTEEEVEALRDACGETKNTIRNRALLELLIYSGQRLSALLTLRIRDVDVDEGYIYLREEDAEWGLKGSTERGLKRPIFGARKYVRDLLEYHPNSDDPDAWLFKGDPNHWKTDPDDHLARPTAQQRLKQIRKEAGVSKPCNPHNFRHYFVTVMAGDYDLDHDTIRMLLGHKKESSALEETYQHVLDERYIEKAEIELGYREPEEKKPLTPETCPTCGEILDDDWRACPACGERFGPSDDFEERVRETSEEIRDDAGEAAISEDLDDDELAAIRAIASAVENPKHIAEQLSEFGFGPD